MKTSRLSLGLAPLCLLVIGCSGGATNGSSAEGKGVSEIPKASVAPGQEATLFPLTLGSQWTYSGEQGTMIPGQAPFGGSGELTRKVTKVEKSPKGAVSTVDVYAGTKQTNRLRFRTDATGIYLLSISLKDTPFSTPQPLLTFPLEKDKVTHWKGHGVLPIGMTGDMETATKFSGIQEVDTASGRVSAYTIESTTTFKVKGTDGVCLSVEWFKPGIGIVRDRQEIRVGNGNLGSSATLRLKSSIVK